MEAKVVKSHTKEIYLWGTPIRLYNKDKGYLTVRLTDYCGQSCSFCTQKESSSKRAFDKYRWYHDMLALKKELAKDKVTLGSIAFSGGEPLLLAGTLQEILISTSEIFPGVTRILYTNGCDTNNLEMLAPFIEDIRITRIQASDTNNKLAFGEHSKFDPMDLVTLTKLPFKEKVSVVLPLFLGGIDAPESLAEYLEVISSTGISSARLTLMDSEGPNPHKLFVPLEEVSPESIPGVMVSRHLFNESTQTRILNYLYSSTRGEILTLAVIQPLDHTKEPSKLVYDMGSLKLGYEKNSPSISIPF